MSTFPGDVKSDPEDVKADRTRRKAVRSVCLSIDRSGLLFFVRENRSPLPAEISNRIYTMTTAYTRWFIMAALCAGMRRRSRESITRVIRYFGMAISIMYIGYAGPKVSEDDDVNTTTVVRVTLQRDTMKITITRATSREPAFSCPLVDLHADERKKALPLSHRE